MIILILAIYNEEGSIPRLIGDIREFLKKDDYKIIAVDDGSSDNSPNLLRQLKGQDIVIVHHKINLSIGAVFLTGFNAALDISKSDDDVIVMMESDQTSDPKFLKSLIDEVRYRGKDISIASRFIEGGGYVNFPFLRKIYSVLSNYILKNFFPIPGVNDYTIFYRSYRAKVLKDIRNFFSAYNLIQSRGFVSNSELLIKTSCFTKSFSEIPFMYDYGNKKGKSKMHILSNVFEYIYFIYSVRKTLDLIKQYQNKNAGTHKM